MGDHHPPDAPPGPPDPSRSPTHTNTHSSHSPSPATPLDQISDATTPGVYHTPPETIPDTAPQGHQAVPPSSQHQDPSLTQLTAQSPPLATPTLPHPNAPKSTRAWNPPSTPGTSPAPIGRKRIRRDPSESPKQSAQPKTPHHTSPHLNRVPRRPPRLENPQQLHPCAQLPTQASTLEHCHKLPSPP